jgi:hypothetical protein
MSETLRHAIRDGQMIRESKRRLRRVGEVGGRYCPKCQQYRTDRSCAMCGGMTE